MKDYETQYAAHYKTQSFETTLVRVRRERVITSLRSHPHRRILEIGCGLEPMFLALDDFERYVVVEPAEEFVRAAQESARARSDITVHCAFLEDVADAIVDEQFDFIIASSLLHEVPEPQLLLGAIRRLCGRDTTVHINVPNVYSFHRLLALEMGLIGGLFEQSETERRFQRHTRFDRPSLLLMLDSNGFRVLESGTYFVKPFTHDQMGAMLNAHIIDERVIEGLNRMTAYLPDMGCEAYADIVVA